MHAGAALATPDARLIPVTPNAQPIAAPAATCLKFIAWPFPCRYMTRPKGEARQAS